MAHDSILIVNYSAKVSHLPLPAKIGPSLSAILTCAVHCRDVIKIIIATIKGGSNYLRLLHKVQEAADCARGLKSGGNFGFWIFMCKFVSINYRI